MPTRCPRPRRLAERITALKAAHTIEAAPQRHTARSTATAEKPVTARIRRRIELPDAPKPAVEPEQPTMPVIAEPDLLRFDADTLAPARPKPSYQDRLTRDKPRKARQMSLF